jgi:RHS repeat-associated protein
VVYTAQYASFGKAAGTGLDWMPFGFAGGVYDSDTGLVRFGAREHDPALGRWVSKDPVLFEGDGPNLYVYVRNDPINEIDVSGEGIVDCYAAVAEYQRSKKILDDRIRENTEKGPDCGHDNAIEEYSKKHNRDKERVIKHCKKAARDLGLLALGAGVFLAPWAFGGAAILAY